LERPSHRGNFLPKKENPEKENPDQEGEGLEEEGPEEEEPVEGKSNILPTSSGNKFNANKPGQRKSRT